jgi:hypothetical protein
MQSGQKKLQAPKEFKANKNGTHAKAARNAKEREAKINHG